jgi:hypothetical protein
MAKHSLIVMMAASRNLDLRPDLSAPRFREDSYVITPLRKTPKENGGGRHDTGGPSTRNTDLDANFFAGSKIRTEHKARIAAGIDPPSCYGE